MAANGKRWPSIWKWAGWVAAVVYLAIVIYLGWRGPYLLARRHANPSVQSAYISAVVTLLGVAATAAVAIFAFGYSRSTNNATIEAAKATTETTVKGARETNQAAIDAAREAQFPDRYSKAVEQLGSGNLDVRIGGIYALEGIDAESARYHPTVLEILAAFIREHSWEQWPRPDPDAGPQPDHTTRPDVQTALTVIGRREAEHDKRPIDLAAANLTFANLVGANLAGANLMEAVLGRAELAGADLTSADLREAVLPEVKLNDYAHGNPAKVTSANFGSADLSSGDSTGVDFTGVDLTGADFAFAILRRLSR